MTPQVALLPDGRLHLQHGPIDLLCQAWGDPGAITEAYHAAAALFATILPALCEERPTLRRPLPSPPPAGAVARTMHGACAQAMAGLPFGLCSPSPGKATLTPMAAVAGAVADHIVSAMTAVPLQKAYVNNGGDIAFHLAPGQSLRCGLVTRLDAPTLDSTLLLHAHEPSRGLATSGRATKGQGGRSVSLGIADSVTILARTAALADAAATLIANAIDLPHPGIQRIPATSIDPDSDLGPTPITWHVPTLTPAEIHRALRSGLETAETLRQQGLIHHAILALQGQFAATPHPERQAA